MGYLRWFERHAKRHAKIVTKLLEKGMDKEAIIDYFAYDNMRIHEVGFCPLYRKNEKCHTMEALNCYLCGCPIFRFSDEGIIEKNGQMQMSGCATHRPQGRLTQANNQLHQDCTHCTLPHERLYIEQVFEEEWSSIMKRCEVE